MSKELTHIDSEGNCKIVNVVEKQHSARIAIAEGWVLLSDSCLDMIELRQTQKGDVLQVAQLAGITGAKKTSEVVPLCHPIPIDSVSVVLKIHRGKGVHITAEVQNVWKTGVEMEALMAVTSAALTVYDMVKAIERDAVITNVLLLYKDGGKSGQWNRPDPAKKNEIE
jgi:cyclic pyranopterin monophosphate synthase